MRCETLKNLPRYGNWIRDGCAAYTFRARKPGLQKDNEESLGWTEDELVSAQPRGFSPEEMLTCESCLRANPPTRTNCLYCGVVLPVTEASAALLKPTLRPLEAGEPGFNVVVLPETKELSAQSLASASVLLRLETDDLMTLIKSDSSLPLARCASREDAELIHVRLSDLGMRIKIVSDSEVGDHAPIRIRTVELNDDSLNVVPTSGEDSTLIPWAEIELIIVGRRIVRKLEVAERSAGRAGKEIVDSREMSSDAERLDLYSKTSERGWRIAAESFDFSGLRERKGPLASKNFQTLVELLRQYASGARFDDSYFRVRRSLGLVWPLDERTESQGFHKPRKGRINTQAVTISDNESQFTRYSKLQHFIKRSSELTA